jgi:type I restriction enzyme S subunit
MMARELVEAFETLAEAPEGVKRLRELVLQLAVRGRLVPQVAGEEAAGRLLERIGKAKAEMAVGQRARIEKPQPGMNAIKPAFPIPPTWEWTPLLQLGTTQTGSTPDADMLGRPGPKLAFVRPNDVLDGTVDTGREAVPLAAAESTGRIVAPGAVLMVCIGTIGKCGVVRDACTFNQQINALQPILVSSDYVGLALRAPFFQSAALGAASATTISILNKGRWEALRLPIPPLAEQHRIVAKVDELMAFLDKLEAAKAARDATRASLRDAALAALRDADSPDEVEVAWARIAEQMDDLFAEPGDVGPLRQAVLQLAVRGRLVRQVEGDEPAGVLLERSSLSEPPFQIPTSWAWIACELLCEHITKGTTPSKECLRPVGEIPYIKVYNLTFDGTLNHGRDPTFVDRETHAGPLARSKVFPGDVLMNIVGPPLGKVSIVPASYPEWNINQAIAIFRTRGTVSPGYLSMVLRLAPMLLAASGNATRGTAGQDNISLAQCRDLPVPLPPLEEQHLIVAKFDELMALLDKLESRLRESKRLQAAFAAAAVHHLDVQSD